jgi:hypothetical protein
VCISNLKEEEDMKKNTILITVAMCLAASTLGGCGIFCNDVGNLEDEIYGQGICNEYVPAETTYLEWGSDCCERVCRRDVIGEGEVIATWEYNDEVGYYTCECCQEYCEGSFCDLATNETHDDLGVNED